MKRLGAKKIRTRVACHSDCAVCHYDNRAGRARERQWARRLVEEDCAGSVNPAELRLVEADAREEY